MRQGGVAPPSTAVGPQARHHDPAGGRARFLDPGDRSISRRSLLVTDVGRHSLRRRPAAQVEGQRW